MPRGDYILRGWAADVSGNIIAERDLLVTLASADGDSDQHGLSPHDN
jgi:hypothetical protein